MTNSDHCSTVPQEWEINVHEYRRLDENLDQMIAQGVSFLNYPPAGFSLPESLIALSSRIRELLSNLKSGFCLIDLGTILDDKPRYLNKAKLLIVIIGNQFGQTITRNHLDKSPFFPVYHRKEGKGLNYSGYALSNNQPGFHTDASGWRDARVDLFALLSVRPAFLGGATILVNAGRVFDTLPTKMQGFLTTRSFIRQDPFNPNNLNPVRCPVYQNVDTGLFCGMGIKYHRAFIERGHELLEEPLNQEDRDMLNRLETCFKKASHRYQFLLASGQILIVNNNFICHDRTRFRDLWGKGRYLERYWAGEFY